jgi:hypothetical protein
VLASLQEGLRLLLPKAAGEVAAVEEVHHHLEEAAVVGEEGEEDPHPYSVAGEAAAVGAVVEEQSLVAPQQLELQDAKAGEGEQRVVQ